jgi:preprotein translocase subunit SecF
MKFNIVKQGKYLLLVSATLLALGGISIATMGLKLGIDFTGGTVLTYTAIHPLTDAQITKGVNQKTYTPFQIQQTNSLTYTITTKPLSQAQLTSLETILNKTFDRGEPASVNDIGPVIGSELESDALKAVILVSIAIILYIAYAFRSVPKPVSSWTFGVTAVLAMAHDVFIVLGAYALLGHFFGATIDTLFITAILTVIGFSVHDTIVVFDRIRENMIKNAIEPFDEIVSNSLMETLGRSVNTSLTVILTLLALFLLGGASIRWFVLTLLIGITSGTYSSIFVASQLLVVYESWKKKRREKN